ncbi:conjugal transfer protein TraF [Ramlibacter humi]|uniref:Conjugal transfer protein TraF n=1 Tax=Ramlibacter humi TaxID=2530451 RepID=A0A4Z0BP84_9BURK|nr:conjugal transfer protein TraF [Ramlibacter humi]TFZ00078.1 conjugal transfer protein TraF [Ramlibacter humi]
MKLAGRTSRWSRCFACLVFAACLAGTAVGAQPAAADSVAGEVPSVGAAAVATIAEPGAEFWKRRRDGWFWYRQDPLPLAQPLPKPAPAAPAPSVKNKDIQEFEDFQRKLESLRKAAIINPTQENVRAYMVYERMAFKQAALFGQMHQSINWIDPVFAEDAADVRPANTVAMGIWDYQRGLTKKEFVSRVSKTHGLYFVIRGDCPYCHALAPVLRRFSDETGMTVFPVSLDGRGNKEYPNPVLDNGFASRLGIKTTPALVLSQPNAREFQVLSFGMITKEEIVDRIYSLLNERRASNAPAAGRLAVN